MHGRKLGSLLERHTQGGERFARYLVAWQNFVGTLACNPEGDAELEDQWARLTNQLGCDVSSESRSTLVLAVASTSYTFLQQQVGIRYSVLYMRYCDIFQQVKQVQESWRTVQCQAVDMNPEPCDDVSLYRLFGFSLFAGIRFRKKAVYGRLRKRFTKTRLQLQVLKSLLESDKSCLPACVKFQDRGKMMFPHRFCRECSLGIRTYLNPSMYNSLGRKVMQVSM